MSTRTPASSGRRGLHLLLVLLAIVFLAPVKLAPAAVPSWTSPNRYRILLTVDPRDQQRSNSPAFVNMDFTEALAESNGNGTFDQHTIEVIAYDASGAPVVFDAARPAYEQYLLPWYVDLAYGITQVTLHFVIPDEEYTQYAVYFDTVESGYGRPERYPGMVGDGDRFTEGYARREINASGYDTFYDFDGDGDLDLFKGGAEPYVFVYENVGANRLIDRGRLTSGGSVFQTPMSTDGNRSWQSLEFCDWDRDGDPDLFLHAKAGPHGGQVICHVNRTTSGGPVTFDSEPVVILAKDLETLATPVRFVDFDGDGKTDVMGSRDGLVVFYRNVGSNGSIDNIQLDDGEYIKANGMEIEVMSAQVECQDMDGDGDLDMFIGTEEGRVYYFQNVRTRTQPEFIMGRLIAFYEFMDQRVGVRVFDFDGDGLLDFVPGRFWERTQWGEQPKVYGRMYKNVGTATAPRFEARDAAHGAPYTERFQIADGGRQNGVRAVDWNNDGRTDLIVGDTDGFVWYFQNQTNQLSPVFAPGVRLWADGQPLRVYGEDAQCDPTEEQPAECNPWYQCRAAGYARVDICDWDNDLRKDLLVADGRGWLWRYPNIGTDDQPVLGAGRRVQANDQPIDGTARASVLVCDWNNDGKKDVILGMAHDHRGYSENWDWENRDGGPAWQDGGFLFYENKNTDADPKFGTPTWVRSGPDNTVIGYPNRPNVGSFAKWTPDDKFDFIGCHFENDCRLYENTGSGDYGTLPEFALSKDGIIIVQPFTAQMMSGADAVDWNRDGDIDILTGQGHGGSGLRYYERDYIEDCLHKTFPIVTAGQTESTIIPTDFDGDEDVDQADFGHLQECVSGQMMHYGPGCANADLDDDGDVDSYDVEHFIVCMGGPNKPPACSGLQ